MNLIIIILLIVFLQMETTNQTNENISNELREMYKADQKERQLLLQGNYNPFELSINDSLRLSRVIQLDKKNQLRTLGDKYYAAMIYHHGGGEKMKDDSLYLLRALSLYEEILNSPFDEVLKDTIEVRDIKETIYYELLNQVSRGPIIKIDTILSKEKRDTSLVIHFSVKEAAKSSRSLTQKKFETTYQTKSKETTQNIDLNKIEDLEYQKFVREIIKDRIKKGLDEKSLRLTEEQINSLVEEQIKGLINLKKSFIKSIQNDTIK